MPASPRPADTNTVVDIRVIPFIVVLSSCPAPMDQSPDKWTPPTLLPIPTSAQIQKFDVDGEMPAGPVYAKCASRTGPAGDDADVHLANPIFFGDCLIGGGQPESDGFEVVSGHVVSSFIAASRA